ncbi:glycosyltransferase involved in cell wall biosynthesis [Geodermatophilus bullaregiensis]|uniref:glycosyltransferase family 2 protein n=1 Tax=Geodermatophilus bullaregiensis TaxID=1564160 RepID=UPI00195A16F1|nr:glycosyltransferase family 2 protein [Geodermatophilus bullaregiensis]MBM7804172.1 glycosyltransferase involved in cell wall biosynthesis [Geodermatophilus bullaregiensis]
MTDRTVHQRDTRAAGAPPRVSVIMIFLDGEAFIDEAITSVMAQSMQDFELLLCDDGSTDGSTAIARHWASQHPGRVRYLQHEGHANRGMSATRNLGLAAARGEFVAFIDADDVWRPRKLAEQIAVMEAHAELALVGGTVRYWRSWAGGEDVLVPTGHVQNRVVRPPEASLAVYPLGSAPAPCPSDILLRRDAVDAVGGFEEHFTGARQIYEDQGFLAKLYLARPVFFSDAVWLDYRQHPDSWVTTVTRDGRYDEVRRYFLTWFDGHLRRLPDEPPHAVRVAVSRALRPYRRPVAHALLSSPGRLATACHRRLRRLRRALRRRVRGTSGAGG